MAPHQFTYPKVTPLPTSPPRPAAGTAADGGSSSSTARGDLSSVQAQRSVLRARRDGDVW